MNVSFTKWMTIPFLGNTRPKIQRDIDKSKEIAQSLPMVNSLSERIETKNCAVVMGAANSGKTEQLKLAAGGKIKQFDLKAEFLKSGSVPKSKYYALDSKEKENHWVQSEFDNIKDELINSNEDVVVLDEIDLTLQKQMSEAEVDTCQSLIKLGASLRDEAQKKKSSSFFIRPGFPILIFQILLLKTDLWIEMMIPK